MKHLLVFTLLIFCSMASAAQATGDPWGTGTDFLKSCTKPTPSGNGDMDALNAGARPINDAVCSSYVFGIFEGIDSVAELLDTNLPREPRHRFICLPREGVTAGEMRDIVTKYILDHRAIAGLKTNRLVSLALSETYPCSTSTSKQANAAPPSQQK